MASRIAGGSNDRGAFCNGRCSVLAWAGGFGGVGVCSQDAIAVAESQLAVFDVCPAEGDSLGVEHKEGMCFFCPINSREDHYVSSMTDRGKMKSSDG
jgi:hypothetical protein